MPLAPARAAEIGPGGDLCAAINTLQPGVGLNLALFPRKKDIK